MALGVNFFRLLILILYSAVYWWLRSGYSSGNVTIGDTQNGWNTPSHINNYKKYTYCIMDSVRKAGNYYAAIECYAWGPGGKLVGEICLL